MKRIPLTQGQFAIVDDDMYEELSKYKWCAVWDRGTQSFYARTAEKSLSSNKQIENYEYLIVGCNKQAYIINIAFE